MYLRHEARYPDEDTIKNFTSKLPKMKNNILKQSMQFQTVFLYLLFFFLGKLHPKIYNLLKKWHLPKSFNASWNYKLTPSGAILSQNMGLRLRKILKDFLPFHFSNESYFVSRDN